MTEWLVMLAAFLLLLAFLGAIAGSWDRRDARRRNHARRIK
jgi:hypothetical protein